VVQLTTRSWSAARGAGAGAHPGRSNRGPTGPGWPNFTCLDEGLPHLDHRSHLPRPPGWSYFYDCRDGRAAHV